MIKEDYVSFEVAKLLKEKGFKEITQGYINTDQEVYMCHFQQGVYELGDKQFPYPTHQMALKWLREVHKLHIIIDKASFYWNYGIYNIKNKNTNLLSIKTDFSSYEQAVESALDYILKNLI